MMEPNKTAVETDNFHTTEITESADQVLPPDTQGKTITLAKVFWGTIIVLFLITMVMLLMAMMNEQKESLLTPASQRAYSKIPKTISAALKKSLPDWAKAEMKKISKELFTETNQVIDNSIDEAFAPVYDNIPKFADAHYSVMGEYVEMGMVASGELSGFIQSQLFAGLEQRLRSSAVQIGKTQYGELQKKIAKHIHDASQQAVPKSQQQEFERSFAEELRKHITSEFRAATAVGGGLAGATFGGLAAVKLIAGTMSRKLLIKLGAKYAAKMAAKTVGGGAMAASGAGLGTLIGGPIGTVVGGVLGGGAGWFGIDALFVTVDEWMNRDEFEQELKDLITEEKNRLKRLTKQVVQDSIQSLASITKPSLVGKTPATLQKSGD